jgi:isopenicillin N synthase-like dioxygenase
VVRVHPGPLVVPRSPARRALLRRYRRRMATVPVIDLSTADAASSIDAALTDIGFMTVVGHGVPRHIVGEAWQAAVDFFGLGDADRASAIDPEGPYGYSPFREEALARSRGDDAPADLKDSFNLGPFDRTADELRALGLGDARIVWPSGPPGFRAAWTAYYRAMEVLGDRLLSLMAVALDLDAGHFAPSFARHTSALRALHYPPLERAPEPGQLRAGAHSDYGSLTILKPGEGRGGLEVRARSGEWVTVPVVRDAFVVNIGDVMERWTNDRWVSTLHRVTIPPDELAATEERFSMAFFQNPSADAVIEVVPTCVDDGSPPAYAPIDFGSWLRAKVQAAHH